MARKDRGEGFLAKFEGEESILIRYDLNAAAAFEDERGFPMIELFQIDKAPAHAKHDALNSRAFIWAGMLFARPELTLREAGELITRYCEGDTWSKKQIALFKACAVEYVASLSPEKKRDKAREEARRIFDASEELLAKAANGTGTELSGLLSGDLDFATEIFGGSRTESSSSSRKDGSSEENSSEEITSSA